MAKGAFRLATLTFLFLNLSLPVLSNGTQFITGPCTSDADCADGCCGFKSGLCAGPVVAQERDGGCGFGDSQPNDNAARALRGEPTTPVASATAAAAAAATTAATAAPAITTTTSTSTSTTATGARAAAAANPSLIGNGAGKQFITGACASDADCASACCGFKSGLCAGPVIAQQRDGGCGFGNAQPNDNAAKALTGSQKRRRVVQF